MNTQSDIQGFMDSKGMNRGQFASMIHAKPYTVTQIMNGESEVIERYRDRIYEVIRVN